MKPSILNLKGDGVHLLHLNVCPLLSFEIRLILFFSEVSDAFHPYASLPLKGLVNAPMMMKLSKESWFGFSIIPLNERSATNVN